MRNQEERQKKGYLIAKALHQFMWASILASLASQIAMTTDAIVVSQFIGPEAISAINLTMPVVIFFNFLMMLFGMGGSVLVARSLGERDAQTTNKVFSSTLVGLTVVGVFFSALLLVFSPQVASFITNDTPVISTLSLRYMRIMLLGTTLTILFMTITNFIKTDGNPKLVMKAVITSSIVNLFFDILFIAILKTGIEGSAWASIIGSVTALLLCSRHFQSTNNSYHWQVEFKQCHQYILKGVKMGFPMGINTLLLGISTYAINSIILSNLGAEGVFAWAVCFQLFVIQQMVLGGIATSIYSIGGLLIGEKDIVGLRLLTNKVMKYICLSLLVFTLFVTYLCPTPDSIRCRSGLSYPLSDFRLLVVERCLEHRSDGQHDPVCGTAGMDKTRMAVVGIPRVRFILTGYLPRCHTGHPPSASRYRGDDTDSSSRRWPVAEFLGKI